VENFEIFQIPVFQTEFILTVKLGDSSLPKLVMIHGYGSGSGLFYKMLKQLSEMFHIYMLDMLGMAGSSRPDFKAVTPKECVDFFTESIEEWRKWLGLEKFYLLGHSFGGYISGLYAVKYS
jgi:pimeloyl-ACP methyl ester carboxylesterase